LRRALPSLAACAVIFVLVGMPFLLRNVISRGYLVAPPEWQSFQLGGSATGLGFRLPDPSITVHTDWPGLIRHVSFRYDSNHAGLGAAFVLVTLPSLLALPFARRRLGPRWWYAVGLAVAGLSYFVVLKTVSIYSVNNIRYLVEMIGMLAALG